jgi:hypothetical protein
MVVPVSRRWLVPHLRFELATLFLFSSVSTLFPYLNLFRISYRDRSSTALYRGFDLNPVAPEDFVGILIWPNRPPSPSRQLQ